MVETACARLIPSIVTDVFSDTRQLEAIDAEVDNISKTRQKVALIIVHLGRNKL